MFKTKGKFFRSMNFRIMVLLFLFGFLSAVLMAEIFLVSYEKQAMVQLSNDVKNQCQILGNQISSADFLHNPHNESLENDLAQVATLYDGRIILIDEDFNIVKDTYALEEEKTMVSEEVVKCFKGEASGYYASGRFVELTVPIMAGSETEKKIAGVILVSASTDSIYAKLSGFRRSSEIWVSVIAICSLAFSILLSNWLVRPLKHMNQYIGDLAEGSLDGDLDIHDCTETENISNTFNIMLARLRLVEESRQEFVANVSHELKTPLTSMKVLADSLLMQGDAPVELYKEFMQDIANEIDRESSVISDLLTLVKMDRKSTELNVASTDINDFIEQILKRLRPIAEKANIELVFESNRSVTAEIDATKLSLAFSNLVENAIKYNRENGWVRVSLDADHKFFYVKVSDSGIGIPQESIDYIFERFYRVDKSHSREIGGTGLGMAITKNIVDMMGGTIQVESEVGKGTEFTVILECETSGVTVKREPIPELKGARALVVDDDAETCMSVSKMLREIEMTADWTTSGKEAVLRAREAYEQNQEFKVYIIDWLMPDMNGIETVRRIRMVVGPESPIIILTAYDWSDVEQEAREAGVTAFVSKPLFLSELREVLMSPEQRKLIQNENQKIQAASQTSYAGKKVLLVEDNELNREIATAIMEEIGLDVDVAEDGTDAVNIMSSERGNNYDLIFMDIQMPKMDGYTATREIRTLNNSKCANIPIIAMTANAFEEDRKKAIKAGMNGHIAKPISSDVILENLDQIFGR